MSTTITTTVAAAPAATAAPETYRLPDLVALCPFKAEFNENHAAVATAAPAWAMGYVEAIIPDAARRAHFQKGYSETLACWVFPYASAERLRVMCDMFNLIFILDEHSDLLSAEGVQRAAQTVLRTFADAAHDDGTVLGRMTADIRDRLMPHMGPASARRFLAHWAEYLRATADEAALRAHHVLLGLPTYTALRRENSAVRICIEVAGFLLGGDLPDAAYAHPVFQALHFATVDLVAFPNDLYSYNREQAMGHKNCNLLTVVQAAQRLSLQGAADYVGAHFKAGVAEFLVNKARLPSFGPEGDAAVQKYIMCMEYWISGNLAWSFDIGRYFGSGYKEMRTALVVELLPRSEEAEESTDGRGDC